MNEGKGELGSAIVEGKQLEAASPADEPTAARADAVDDGSSQKRFSTAGGSSLANKIAAFASGIAPVKQGITNASEDAITVEDVLHKLESASRAATSAGKVEIQQVLVRSAHDHLVSARSEASRVAKELQELKNSRVQHIPPSAWVKRESKYKMDLEKYEHKINMQQQRIDRLEAEVQVLREGANVKPLEERIQELETQLVAASEEKTKVQSKYHELSIKHRQLIETSPQVATIWNEVLQQQHAAGHGDSAAMQRLSNFDLRHTGMHSGLAMPVTGTATGHLRNGEVSPRKLPGVSTAAAIFSNGGGPPPVPAVPVGSKLPSSAATTAAAPQQQPQLMEAGSIEQGPQTPVLSNTAAAPVAVAARNAGVAPAAPAVDAPQTSEDKAKALMAAVALEGLSPEASVAALQQLNYDLTMQLGLYQQMVARLKDAMEQSDLEKAELEAEKITLESQLAAAAAGAAGAGGGDHPFAPTASGSVSANSRSGRSGWGLFWRKTATGANGDDNDAESAFADASSMGLGSLSSSRRSSMNLDDAGVAAAVLSQLSSPLPRLNSTGTPTSLDAEQQQQQQQLRNSHSGDGSSNGGQSPPPVRTATAPAAVPVTPTAGAAAPATSGGFFSARRARAASRAASAAENMQKEVKELKRQLTSVQDENKFLVQNLVQIKMELAETQSNHDQAKRALVRAMDKEACLDIRVNELTHMLDMLTQQQQQQQQDQAGNSGLAQVAEHGVSMDGAAAVGAASAGSASAESLSLKEGSDSDQSSVPEAVTAALASEEITAAADDNDTEAAVTNKVDSAAAAAPTETDAAAPPVEVSTAADAPSSSEQEGMQSGRGVTAAEAASQSSTNSNGSGSPDEGASGAVAAHSISTGSSEEFSSTHSSIIEEDKTDQQQQDSSDLAACQDDTKVTSADASHSDGPAQQ